MCTKKMCSLIGLLLLVYGCGGGGAGDSNTPLSPPAKEVVDFDSDGIPDASDNDDDNDGTADENDAFPKNSSETTDTDGDGIGNNEDSDDDGDGVEDSADAFPLDSTEFADRDNDGIGSNTDFYDNDSACSKEVEGDGTTCYSTLISQQFDNITSITTQPYTIFYDIENAILYRFEHITKEYMVPISIPSSAAMVDATYSQTLDKTILAFDDGNILALDENGVVDEFATVSGSEIVLETSTDKVIVATNYDGIRVFDSQGVQLDHYDFWVLYDEIVKDTTNNGFAFSVRNGWTVGTFEINPISGKVENVDRNRPFYEATSLQPSAEAPSTLWPLLVPPSHSDFLLIGHLITEKNEVFDYKGSTNIEVTTLHSWDQQNNLYSLSGDQTTTHLSIFDGNLRLLTKREYEGSPISIHVGTENVTIMTNHIDMVKVFSYEINEDIDGDSVLNSDDSFPADIAASVDSDLDGYPDVWNDGYTTDDSTTGLQLDHFPANTSCWTAEHMLEGGGCNYSATIPSFELKELTKDSDGNIYLLSDDHDKIFIWSTNLNAYLKPISIGFDRGFFTELPSDISYSASSNRLYLGYRSGELTSINLDSADISESLFYNELEKLTELTAGNGIVFANGRAKENSFNTQLWSIDEDGRLLDNIITNSNANGLVFSRYTYALYYMFNEFEEDVEWVLVAPDDGIFVINSRVSTDHEPSESEPFTFAISKFGARLAHSSGGIYATRNSSVISIVPQFDTAIYTHDDNLLTQTMSNSDVDISLFDNSSTFISSITLAADSIWFVKNSEATTIVTKNEGKYTFQSYSALFESSLIE